MLSIKTVIHVELGRGPKSKKKSAKGRTSRGEKGIERSQIMFRIKQNERGAEYRVRGTEYGSREVEEAVVSICRGGFSTIGSSAANARLRLSQGHQRSLHSLYSLCRCQVCALILAVSPAPGRHGERIHRLAVAFLLVGL